MRAPLAVSFAIAAACHAGLLFGFRFETSAQAFPMGSDTAAVDLDLAAEPEGAPDAASAAPALAETDSTPAPEPAQDTPPEPAPEPVPSLDPPAEPLPTPAALPSPSPDPAMAAATPPPAQPAPPAKRQNPGKKQPSPSTLHPATEGGSPAHGQATGSAASAGGNAGGGMAGVRVRSNPRPEYPAKARSERQEGVVLVSVEIGPDGSPEEVALGHTSGFPLLDDAAVRTVRRWRFEPASAAGRAIASHAEVPIRFNLVP